MSGLEISYGVLIKISIPAIENGSDAAVFYMGIHCSDSKKRCWAINLLTAKRSWNKSVLSAVNQHIMILFYFLKKEIFFG